MTKRGYRTMSSVWGKIIALKPNYNLIPLEEVYKEKMDTTYLIICYWNLMEKHLCGGISDIDIHNIQNCLMQNMTNKLDKVITYD